MRQPRFVLNGIIMVFTVVLAACGAENMEEDELSAENNSNYVENSNVSSNNENISSNNLVDDEDIAPQNCSDFSDGREVFNFWSDNGYHSSNDPLNLDGNSSGVPCEVLTSDLEEDFKEYENSITASNQSADEETATMDLNDYIEMLVEDISGLETGHEDYPFTLNDIESLEQTDDMQILEITLVSHYGWSPDSIKNTSLDESVDYFKRIFADREEFQRVEIYWLAPFTDQYGNTELGEMVNVDLTKDTSERINWDQFDAKNLPEVADYYHQHQSFD
ncbi:hypothetical protein [Alkalicoccus chagannorensis]|uniref:hypothetical protein n=1 Tax=Alkalicoccus chagannorensis TaxID=427072 RepID=UPI0004244809|nr:hypothetical protein [Alkalicoccus chagannorensis]